MNSSRPTLALILAAVLAATLMPLASAGAVEEPVVVVDDMEAPLGSGQDGDGNPVGWGTFQDPNSSVSIDRSETPPAPRPGAADPNQTLELTMNVDAFAGVSRLFSNDSLDVWTTQDWSAYQGFAVWVYGQNTGTSMFVDVIDNRSEGSTTDDAERWSVSFVDDFTGWELLEWTWDEFARKGVGNGAPDDGFNLTAVHGWALGSVTTAEEVVWYVDDVQVFGERELELSFAQPIFSVAEDAGTATVTVELTTTSPDQIEVVVETSDSTDRTSSEDLIATPDRDYVPTSVRVTIPAGDLSASADIPLIDDAKDEVPETFLVILSDVPDGLDPGPQGRASVSILDDDPFEPLLLEDFEDQYDPAMLDASPSTDIAVREVGAAAMDAVPGQGLWERVLDIEGAGTVEATWAFPEDLSGTEGLSVWLNGAGDGSTIDLTLADNRAPDPGPEDWVPLWSDEFEAPAGTPADPDEWTYETGGWGWGNQELQYYTDSTSNAAHDGEGNMVITAREVANPESQSLPCWYGPCTHTSARLITEGKRDFGYGRWEARVLVAEGPGIWPAFWSLGNDFRRVGWPQTGEIDVMEFVGRLPTSIFGTIHGPGYSGGQSYGSGPIEVGEFVDGGTPGEEVSERFHTFATQWQEGLITWELDGQQYHTAVPSDVAPNEWVFDHPFTLLMNVALGGNFGGALGEDLSLPQDTLFDYVRVTGPADTAERFTATITDDVAGWTRVDIPWSAFTRSAMQPDGAPDDGLTLSETWGWQLAVSDDQARSVDQIRAIEPACLEDQLVTSTSDAGAGSLRAAIAAACDGSTITLTEAVDQITLASQLLVGNDVTIVAESDAGAVLSGAATVRVMQVQPEAEVTLDGLTVADGAGAVQGGGILNYGDLTMIDGVVRDNVETDADGSVFDRGGGGIWTGENARLELIRTTVENNATTSNPGGGLYGFFGSEMIVRDSAIVGNVAADVAGGIRSLGTLEVRDSTISSNVSTAWHGGGIFATDGSVTLHNVTVALNQAPAERAGGILAANFGNPISVTITNSVIAANTADGAVNCALEGGAAPFVSGGGNVVSDASCSLGQVSDLSDVDPLLGPLTDAGSPTPYHPPAEDSPVIDAGVEGCDAADQRGVPRTDNSCDSGSIEFVGEDPVDPGPDPTDTPTDTDPDPDPDTDPDGPDQEGPDDEEPDDGPDEGDTDDGSDDDGPDADEPTVTQVFGDSRVQTAVEISRLDFADGSADAVILATAADYPDALAGAPLALAENGPLLLSFPDTLADETAAEISRVLPEGGTVVILGGLASLPQGIEDALTELGFQVERVEGPSRVETAVAVAARLGEPEPLLIATGYNFPDALSAGAAAASTGGAVLLTGDGQAVASTDAYLVTRPAVTRYAIGGPAAEVYPGAVPLVGSGRDETAVLVARTLFDGPSAVGLARNDDYPDALAGGPHIARRGGPLLLSGQEELTPAPAAYVCQTSSVDAWWLYGGPAALSPTVSQTLGALTTGDGCPSSGQTVGQ